MSGLILPSAKLKLETRMRSDIDNFMDRKAPYPGLLAQRQKLVDDYKSCAFRNVGPSFTYNCHGMTFASRRTQITAPKQVEVILREDDYKSVLLADVLPGDVAIYYSTGNIEGSIAGDIEHSAFVIGRVHLEGLSISRVRVVSRWGSSDEVIHFVNDCPYDIGDIRYFRVQK